MKITIKPDLKLFLDTQKHSEQLSALFNQYSLYVNDWCTPQTITIDSDGTNLLDHINEQSTYLFGFTGNKTITYFHLNSQICSATITRPILDDSNALKALRLIDNIEIIINDNAFMDIEFIKRLPQLCHIKIKSEQQRLELAPLNTLTSIKSLSLSGIGMLITPNSGICTTPDLSKLVQLERLTLQELARLPSLKNLPQLKNLEIIRNGDITEVSFIAHLKSLSQLYLNDCFKLSDISSISTLVHLKKLSLYYSSRITNIDALKNLKNLTFLDLRGLSELTDYSTLKNLTALDYLDISSNSNFKDTDLKLIPSSIKQLDLSYNNITTTDGLSSLTNLQELNLTGCNKIKCYSGLKKLHNLTKLNLITPYSGNNLNFLKDLRSLEYLDLNSSLCNDIHSLSGLKKLIGLHLSRCFNLKNITPIKHINTLRYLNIDQYCGDASVFSQFYTLTNLTKLSINGCTTITNLKGFSRFTSLQNLHLMSCENLSNIDSLQNLTDLRTLYLDDSPKITSISALRECTNLKYLSGDFHPAITIEILAYTAAKRKDNEYILMNAQTWVDELIEAKIEHKKIAKQFNATLKMAFNTLANDSDKSKWLLAIQ
jgi:Leucine-rich repeat (LRR) protein